VTAAEALVFVIDDDSDVRAALEETLRDEGYDVICASDGADALDKLRVMPLKPDVLLLDLMMPTMNGWQFREQQLKDPALADICTVVLTADASATDAALDGVHFVRKPVKLATLLDAIEACRRDD
jgi:CheY-like chemotaxis protein